MAKKKSKTQKQTQKRAAKKLATAFAKKLGVSQNGAAQSPGMGMSIGTNPTTKTAVRKKQQTTKLKSKTNKKTKNRNTMDMEFRQEHAAVQERGQVMEWKRNNNSKSKRKKQTSNKQSTNHTTSTTTTAGNTPPLFQLAPPTFAVDDKQKSTPQLIAETTQRVQQNGTTIFGMGGPLATAGMDSLASMSAALQWNVAATTTTPTTISLSSTHNNPGWGRTFQNHSNTNPWAVLDQPDTDETPATAQHHPFSFAPPSFAVAIPTEKEEEEGVDPDL